MMEVDLEKVFYKVLEACRIAEGLNVGIVTLGGFTSIVGEQFGKEIHKMVTVPVTTGNTYTAALVVRGVLEACEKMRVPISQQKLVIFGGSGDIGSACALALSKKVKHLKLIGRDVEKLEKTRNKLKGATAEISIGTDLAESIPDADIIIAATSATSALVDSSMFQPGTIICDVGYPKNIAYKLGDRDDLMIFAGGLCQLPSKFELGLKADYGLHHDRVLYGCLSEAIVLDLEKRYESYSAGRGNITVEKMDAIYEMGLKHGFSLAPFLMGDRILDENDFDRLSEIRAKIS